MGGAETARVLSRPARIATSWWARALSRLPEMTARPMLVSRPCSSLAPIKGAWRPVQLSRCGPGKLVGRAWGTENRRRQHRSPGEILQTVL